MNKDIEVVTAIIRKNTGIMHIDRYNSNSNVYEQAIREIERIGTGINKVVIETDNSTYIIKWDE